MIYHLETRFELTGTSFDRPSSRRPSVTTARHHRIFPVQRLQEWFCAAALAVIETPETHYPRTCSQTVIKRLCEHGIRSYRLAIERVSNRLQCRNPVFLDNANRCCDRKHRNWSWMVFTDVYRFKVLLAGFNVFPGVLANDLRDHVFGNRVRQQCCYVIVLFLIGM